MKENVWYRAARKIVKAGQLPIATNDTLIELLKNIMSEEEAKFISIFRKPSLNINQIKEKSDLSDSLLDNILNSLMDKGVVVGVPSKTTGIMVYRLLGPFPGLFEMQFLKGEKGDKQIKLAQLFEKLFLEMSEGTQRNYDIITSQYRTFPPITRVVPVEEKIEDIPVDKIMPY